MLQSYYPEFLTATIYNWQHLLKDNYKQIITDSFNWLVTNKCTINAFVIMPNHFHLLWKIADGLERKDVQGALFSFTAHEFKKYLKKNDSATLEKHPCCCWRPRQQHFKIKYQKQFIFIDAAKLLSRIFNSYYI